MIELSTEILSDVKFIQEKKLRGKYIEEISWDTGNYVCGVEDTVLAILSVLDGFPLGY